MHKKSYPILPFCLVFATTLYGQRPSVEMADALRQDGKIYVVVLIMGIIFLGVAAYLYYLDRKIGRLEKEKQEE